MAGAKQDDDSSALSLCEGIRTKSKLLSRGEAILFSSSLCLPCPVSAPTQAPVPVSIRWGERPAWKEAGEGSSQPLLPILALHCGERRPCH